MEMLGGALKAGIPMEKSPSGVTGVIAYKQSTKAFTTHEPKQLLLMEQQIDLQNLPLKLLQFPHMYQQVMFQYKLALQSRN